MRVFIQGQPVEFVENGNRYDVFFRYHEGVKNEIKSTFENPSWDKEKKKWSVSKSHRNEIQLAFYRGENPFKIYKEPLSNFKSKRDLLAHQQELVNAILSYRKIIGAYEMGLGKSLIFIESAEISGYDNILYVGPKSGIASVKRELEKWKVNLPVEFMTYEKMTKTVNSREIEIPDYVFFDESSKLKTYTSARSKAGRLLVKEMNKKNKNSIVFLGTGTPAPKSPTDWYSQCEVVCEGFVKEANAKKFEERLSVQETLQFGEDAKPFNKIKFWLDNEKKCKICGLMESDYHDGHLYQPSVNEVAKLFNRLKGLVWIKFKKDCLNLPEKIYEQINIKPTPEMFKNIKVIKDTATMPTELASQMMQISDGFLYVNEIVGKKVCAVCNGSKKGINPVTNKEDDCDGCRGKGEQDVVRRSIIKLQTPKDEALIEQLEDHEEVGRLVVWCGFQETIDRVCDLVLKQGWHVLKYDGRGKIGLSPEGKEVSVDSLLTALDKSNPAYQDTYEKVCFVGNAGAGGMGLTLTASPTAVYYSNSNLGEARMQSEDRIHRIGISISPKIVDFLCLPIDRLVLNSLKQKKDLQSLTMGEILEAC